MSLFMELPKKYKILVAIVVVGVLSVVVYNLVRLFLTDDGDNVQSSVAVQQNTSLGLSGDDNIITDDDFNFVVVDDVNLSGDDIVNDIEQPPVAFGNFNDLNSDYVAEQISDLMNYGISYEEAVEQWNTLQRQFISAFIGDWRYFSIANDYRLLLNNDSTYLFSADGFEDSGSFVLGRCVDINVDVINGVSYNYFIILSSDVVNSQMGDWTIYFNLITDRSNNKIQMDAYSDYFAAVLSKPLS